MVFATVDWPSVLVGAGAIVLTWTVRDYVYEKRQSAKAEPCGKATGKDAAKISPGPSEETGGGPTTAWGRINEKPLTGATVKDDTAFLLHSIVGLDRYPRFLQRLREPELRRLEAALETLHACVNQSRSVVSAQATAVHEALDAHATATTTANSPPADSTFSAFNADPAAHRIDDVLAPELCAALGWGSIRSKARARSKEEEGKGWSVAAAIAAGPQQTAPGARQVHELLEAVDDSAEAFSFPLLQPSFCARLIAHVDLAADALDAHNSNSKNNSDIASADSAATPPQRTKSVNLDLARLDWVSDLLLLVSDAVAQRTHAPETLSLSPPFSSSSSSSSSSTPSSRKRAPLDWRHGYVLRYEPTQRSSLTPHTDDAEITLNVCLSPDGSFQGGELLLGGIRGKAGDGKSGNWLDPATFAAEADAYSPSLGRGLLHLGRQKHAVAPVTAGVRRVLIVWARSYRGTRARICPCCWHNRRHDGQEGDCICGPAWN